MPENYSLSECNEVLEKVRSDLKKFTKPIDEMKGNRRNALMYLGELSHDQFDELTSNMKEYYCLWKRTSFDSNLRDLYVINKLFRTIHYLKRYDFTIEGIEQFTPLLNTIVSFNHSRVQGASLKEQKILSIGVLSQLITSKDSLFTFIANCSQSILDVTMVDATIELEKYRTGIKSWHSTTEQLRIIAEVHPELTALVRKISDIISSHTSALEQRIIHPDIPFSVLFMDFNTKLYQITHIDAYTEIESLAQYKLLITLFNLKCKPTTQELHEFKYSLFRHIQNRSVKQLNTDKYDQEYLNSIKDLPRIARIYFGFNTVKK